MATGVDPRAVGGRGKALTQALCHSATTTMEPIVQLISAGVFEQYPALHAVTVESGVGWIPWCVNQMDHYFRAHHMWVRPVLPEPPSFYFRRNCAATFIEEPEILPLMMELGFEDNILWSSDYPHHEGVWPHCLASIERQLGSFSEIQRQKALGLNAQRIFKIKAR